MRGIERIPGGSQLYSKRPDRFSPNWPRFYSHAAGARVWADREYVDMSSNGVGACPLGYADRVVNAVVRRALGQGSATTLNCPEEAELADLLCELHPWAEMVRFARGGGEAMSVAVRIARAATGRTRVAVCGYHGWCDWYQVGRAGVPAELDHTVIPFEFNRPPELPDDLAAIILEPQRTEKPTAEFLAAVRKAADGAVLIFDEITSGFRLCAGGVHMLYGTEPDIAVFAKGIGNGIPISAVIGREDVMSASEDTFISSTAWSERLGPAAALATIRRFREHRVHKRLIEAGQAVQAGWQDAIDRHGIDAEVEHRDMPPLSHLRYRDPAQRTLHCEMMLERGYLDNCDFYATYAHRPEIIRAYLDAVEEVLPLVQERF